MKQRRVGGWGALALLLCGPVWGCGDDGDVQRECDPSLQDCDPTPDAGDGDGEALTLG